jgi:hypothetical protein
MLNSRRSSSFRSCKTPDNLDYAELLLSFRRQSVRDKLASELKDHLNEDHMYYESRVLKFDLGGTRTFSNSTI